MEPKVVKSGEKWIMYGLFGGIDALQVALDFTVWGEVANHFIDIGAGLILLGYGIIKKLWTGQKLLILLATFIGEQIPFVNALPFWVLDVKNLYSGTITPEEKEVEEQEELLQNNRNAPYYSEGVRQPRSSVESDQDQGPANRGSIRPANPNLRPIINRVPMIDVKGPIAN